MMNIHVSTRDLGGRGDKVVFGSGRGDCVSVER